MGSLIVCVIYSRLIDFHADGLVAKGPHRAAAVTSLQILDSKKAGTMMRCDKLGRQKIAKSVFRRNFGDLLSDSRVEKYPHD